MSKLEDVSLQYRTCTIVMNDYKSNKEYTAGHPDALSDGDELGKGELNGNVGGKTDIKTRTTLITKNKYKNTNEYNSGTA